MPEEGGNFGFLPAVPDHKRGASARPQKPRAVEMDETLNKSQKIKQKMEHANKRQQQTTMKLKEHKQAAKSLMNEVNHKQEELDDAKAEAERNKVDPEVKSRFDKLSGDHATLQATHAWTKSSLDSTLAAQEEYRKGYTSLQAAYKKTKGELERKEKDAAHRKEEHEEARKLKESVPEKEAEFQQDLADAQEGLRRIIERQKKKSKAVLDKMILGQSSTLLQLTFQTWQKTIVDEKFWRENAAALEQAQQKLKDFEGKHKQEASRVLDRMSAANEAGLTQMMFQYWSQQLAEAKKEREEAAKLNENLKNAKDSAKKTLMANLNSSTTGILTNAMRDWIAHFREHKKVTDLKAQADSKLRDYQSKKKGEQASVIERMAGEQTEALMMRMFMSWSMTCLDESAARHAVNDLTNKADDLEAILNKLNKELEQVEEDLVDTNEEIEESRRKNKLLVQEFKSIMDLESSLDKSMKEMDDD